MSFSILDWMIIVIFLLISLLIGVWSSKGASQDTQKYFLAGRNMPWWLLGISMVATTFSTDTPNLVTDLVRQNGVSSNWLWWSFLITGMLTVFIYAKLWRRSGIITDIEFYELRKIEIVLVIQIVLVIRRLVLVPTGHDHEGI